MSTTKISMNYELGVQKGPACDASQITEMKRKQAIVRDVRDNTANGRATIVDGQHTRGFTSGVLEVHAKGAFLNFFPVQ